MTVVVRARDLHDGPYPKGKQSHWYENRGCWYTRTTGIWQTVWMEPVPTPALGRPRVTPDVGGSRFHVEQPIALPHGGGGGGGSAGNRVTLSDGDGEVARAEVPLADLSPRVVLDVPADRRRLWGPGAGNLYDLAFELLDADGSVRDRAAGYAGLRSVQIDGRAVLINGEPVFQRLVLDQSFYAEGVWTAPTDADLVRDIELSMAAGFNGARLHEKVFEERFLYHADRLGYLCWGEFPDWGCGDYGAPPERPAPGPGYITQWLEVLERDYSRPSIVGWCGANELGQPAYDAITGLDDVLRGMFLAAKAMDTSRPVLDVSGWPHRVPEADVYDTHDYEQDPDKLRARYAPIAAGELIERNRADIRRDILWTGQPYWISEFGGVWWNPAKLDPSRAGGSDKKGSWGYGKRPESEGEFLARFEGLCAALLDHPAMFGYCYTQLTDVHQEENGVYYFDRTPKVDAAGMERIRNAQTRPAAIEQRGDGA